MYLLDDYEISFHASPRTAGRSVGNLICQLGGREVAGHHDEPRKVVPAHYRSFTIVRPHHEVWGVMIGSLRPDKRKLRERLGDHLKQQNSQFVQFGPHGWEMYWRRHWCEEVLFYNESILYDVAGLLEEWGVEIGYLDMPRLGTKRDWSLELTDDEHRLLYYTFEPEINDLFGEDYGWTPTETRSLSA
jgi:hypothetical protein